MYNLPVHNASKSSEVYWRESVIHVVRVDVLVSSVGVSMDDLRTCLFWKYACNVFAVTAGFVCPDTAIDDDVVAVVEAGVGVVVVGGWAMM